MKIKLCFSSEKKNEKIGGQCIQIENWWARRRSCTSKTYKSRQDLSFKTTKKKLENEEKSF